MADFRPGDRVRGCQVKPSFPGYGERCNWYEGTYVGKYQGDLEIARLTDRTGQERLVWEETVVPLFEPQTPFEKSLHSYIDKELCRG